MSDVAKLYEGLSEKTQASLDGMRDELKKVGNIGSTGLTYFCYGYLIGQGATAPEANNGVLLAQKKNFWK